MIYNKKLIGHIQIERSRQMMKISLIEIIEAFAFNSRK